MKKHLFFYFILMYFTFTAVAAEKRTPPLAPPSTFALSLEDMVLHFKIFIIADIFKTIAFSGMPEQFFELTDPELDILLKAEMEKNPLLVQTKPLNFFFYRKNLFINIEDLFFKCFHLEVIPEQFELKIDPVSEAVYLEQLKLKGKKNASGKK